MKAPRKEVRISLYVDAIEALADLATERKRGEFISELILIALQQNQQAQLAALARQSLQIASDLRATAAQLDYLGD